MTKFVCIVTNLVYIMTKFVYAYDKLCVHMLYVTNIVYSMTKSAYNKQTLSCI